MNGGARLNTDVTYGGVDALQSFFIGTPAARLQSVPKFSSRSMLLLLSEESTTALDLLVDCRMLLCLNVIALRSLRYGE
jgi:hypothetical protein